MTRTAKTNKRWAFYGPRCQECGYREHMAIHQPPRNAPDGSPPWGHEYKPPPRPRGGMNHE